MEIGERFGKLVVLSIDGKMATCRCDCGNTKKINKYSLMNGVTKACGCGRGRKPTDLPVGTRFGKLVVLKNLENKEILCQCDCGKTTTIKKYSLTRGKTRSCGCARGRKPRIIPPGTRFGKLVVKEDVGNKTILCLCDCGRTTLVHKYNLIEGKTKSCGCAQGVERTILNPGDRIGKLTVIKPLENKMILCQCECGKTAIVQKYNLTRGRTKSCGCGRKGPRPNAKKKDSAEKKKEPDKSGKSKVTA